ncbi:MAG: rhomboid family intramembrane serine protease [Bacteroidales bacterium]
MQTGIWDEIKAFFLKGSVLARLIGINIAVFILVSLIRVILYLANAPAVAEALPLWLGIPSNLHVIILRPWTLVTYMFLHFEFFHILFNMIVLYVGGRLFSEFIGPNRLTGTYLLGGIAGALVFVISFNLFPVFEPVVNVAVAIGASASVLAIFVAIATYAPNHHLHLLLVGRVKLKYIAIFFVVIDLISIDQGNPGGHLAHLGGAFWGFLYARMLRHGQDPALQIGAWINALGGVFKPRPRMRVEYRAPRPKSDDEYNRERLQHQQRIDEILEKISRRGYESLSREEKELLFREGNKN